MLDHGCKIDLSLDCNTSSVMIRFVVKDYVTNLPALLSCVIVRLWEADGKPRTKEAKSSYIGHVNSTTAAGMHTAMLVPAT